MGMSRSTSDVDAGSKYSYAGLDRVIHERARLSVLTSLAAHAEGLRFSDLKKLCGLTDGNLSRHVQILEAAQLLEVTKSFENNRPQTICRLTAEGRDRFINYLSVLEQVVRDATTSAQAVHAGRTG